MKFSPFYLQKQFKVISDDKFVILLSISIVQFYPVGEFRGLEVLKSDDGGLERLCSCDLQTNKIYF